MSPQLSRRDRLHLERVAAKKAGPSRRQKALALLGFAQGIPAPEIAEQAGMSEGQLSRLIAVFQSRGLAGLGLAPPSGTTAEDSTRTRHGTIESSPGICGGSARISGTRIPVWALVEARDLGVSEAQILLDYPALSATNLVDAWDYARRHRPEIDEEIHRNAAV